MTALGRRGLLVGGGGGLAVAIAGCAGARSSPAPPSAPPAVARSWSPRSLDAHALATIKAMSEHIIAGATEARVYELVDTVMGAAEPPARSRLRQSLAALDEMAGAHHGASFADTDRAGQLAILTQLATEGRALESAKRIADAHTTWSSRWCTSDPSAEHASTENVAVELFQIVRMLTIYGYYTSRPGLEAVGRASLFHPAYPGCTHPEHG